MYTDEDLETAVEKGIFTDASVKAFREDYQRTHGTHTADEENFKLLSSFNDVFVVMAIGLLLLSLGGALQQINSSLSSLTVAVASWVLAEFFILKRKMALPAIVLLITFVGAVFYTVVFISGELSENMLIMGALVASVSAWIHWKRFHVPITVAAGTVALISFVILLLISLSPVFKNYLIYMLFFSGLVVFLLAMYWDNKDLNRIAGSSDVAFWLHLAAAPFIVHPIFSMLGVLDGNESYLSLVGAVLLYLLVTAISIVIDRRAFMVSSLAYVLAALSQLLKTHGFAGDSFVYVGVLIGFSLLLLSGFWHKARRALVTKLPEHIQNRVPATVPNA